jgi:hypothetical protein
VEVTDDDGGFATDSINVTVRNMTPTVDAGENQTVSKGESLAIVATFGDLGIYDLRTVTLDWGDIWLQC